MRLIVLALAVVGLGSAAQDVSPAADEAAVCDVIRRYAAAREQWDPRAVEALFTEDADRFTTSGDWRRGRPADEIVGGANAGRRMWTTLLLTRGAGDRRIAAIRNMVPTGSAPAADR